MSSRFGHLEFDDKRRQQEAPATFQTGTPTASAEQFLRQAQDESRLGQFEPALRLYTRCLEEDRGMIVAWVGQVQMLVQLAEHQEARLWADKALELFRNNGELLAAKAQAAVRHGDRRAAYACSDASMKSPGSSSFRWQARGEVLLASKEKTHDACFKKSLAEPSSDWYDRVLIANIYLYYRRAASALEYASAALQLSPGSAYAWLVLGRCQQQLGLNQAAAASYGRSLEIRPRFAEASGGLAQMSSESFLRQVLRWLRRGR